MENQKPIISINDVTVRFNLSKERIENIKEYMVKLLTRSLMFQEHLALQHISFQVQKGEAWGIVGVNGSGKSTLLKLICGILKPYNGSLEVNGTIAPLIELGAGFDGELTARENIYMNGAILGHSKQVMNKYFKEIVDFAELEEFLDVPIKNFSSGMSARLGFSIATMVRNDILIVDEILAVGDDAFQKKCEKRMQEILSGGTTLLYVSHDIDQVRRMCKKVLWLEKGEMKKIGDVDEVCDAYTNRNS